MQYKIKNSKLQGGSREVFVGGEKLTANFSYTPVFSFPCFMSMFQLDVNKLQCVVYNSMI